MSDMIRVLVVDDHAVVRKGLAVSLTTFPDVELVGEADNGQSAITLCLQLKPDVVLMDLIMPIMSGVEAIHVLRQECAEIEIIAISSFDDEELVRSTVEAGAAGYLLKNFTLTELGKAIHAVVEGETYLSVEASRALMSAMRHPTKLEADLTERELQVLRHVEQGMTNKEIAEVLVVSPTTVKKHVRSILMKLNANTRTEAASLARRLNLIDA